MVDVGREKGKGQRASHDDDDDDNDDDVVADDCIVAPVDSVLLLALSRVLVMTMARSNR